MSYNDIFILCWSRFWSCRNCPLNLFLVGCLIFWLVDFLIAWEISCLSEVFSLFLGEFATTKESLFHPLSVQNPYKLHNNYTFQELIVGWIYRSLGTFVHCWASKFIFEFFLLLWVTKISQGGFYFLWVTKIALRKFFLCCWIFVVAE